MEHTVRNREDFQEDVHMRDSFFFLKLRAFLTGCRLRYRYARSGWRRRWRVACEARARLRDLYEQRQASPFRLESLEARVLLAADMAGAAKAAQLLIDPAIQGQNGNGNAPAVVATQADPAAVAAAAAAAPEVSAAKNNAKPS